MSTQELAEPRVASIPDAVADVIVEVAEEIDASLIVLGSRARQGLRTLLAGSTSTQVLHAAGRPTLSVPSRPLAAARRQTRPATDSRTSPTGTATSPAPA